MMMKRYCLMLIFCLALAPMIYAQNPPLTPITVENVAQVEQLAVWEGMNYDPRNITFNEDLTGFVTYSYETNELSLWAVNADHSVTLIHTTPAMVYAIKHQHVAYQVSEAESTLHIWDLNTGTELIPVENAASPTVIAWNSDATRLAYVTDEDTIEVLDIITRERLSQNHLDGSEAQALSFVAPLDELLTQTHRNTGMTLNTIGFDGQRSGFFLQTPTQRFASILFSPDQSTVFITEWFYRSGENGFIYLTDVWGKYSSYIGTFEGGGLGFLPNGFVYSSANVGGPSRETTITLRDPNTLEIRKTFVYGGAVKTSALGWWFSPDGTRLVTVTWDFSQEGGRSPISKYAYTFWDVESGEVIATSEPIESAGRVAFSPDSTLLATDNGQHIALWDAQTGELLTALTGHTDFVTKLVFSSDGTRLVSISNDGTIRVWGVVKS